MKIVLIVFLYSIFLLSVSAQITKVIGTVYDEKGAVISNAKVILTELQQGVTITHTRYTDDSGHYEIKSESGNCRFEVTTPNRPFKPFIIRKYIVVQTDQMYLDVVLELQKPKLNKKRKPKKGELIL